MKKQDREGKGRTLKRRNEGRERTPERQDRGAEERTLHIPAGKKIEFPVPAKHPLARFQTLTPVRSGEDIHEFLLLWARNATAREQPTPDSATLLARLRQAKLEVLRLATNDLRIESGAVLTLNNPLNQLQFDNVTIAGELVSRGELILKCHTLTIQ